MIWTPLHKEWGTVVGHKMFAVLAVTYLSPEASVPMGDSLQSSSINLLQAAFPSPPQMKVCAGSGKLTCDGSEPKQEAA